MNLTFESGTEDQQARWRQALGCMLHLTPDEIPVSVTVSFVDPSEVADHGHTDFALTTWTYDSLVSETKVRNDAPGFGGMDAALRSLAASLGLPYNSDTHFNETACHELGHSLYAALPEEHRVAIAQMFGAQGDSLEELQPVGVAWQDQIIEGIAETFKEAFLPRRFRIFSNRTNKKIPYNEYPRFRSLFRIGTQAAGGAEAFERDLVSGIKTDIGNPSFRPWESRSEAAQEINVPSNFSYSVAIPRSLFIALAEGKDPFTIYGRVEFALQVKDIDTAEVIHFARGAWLLSGDFDLSEAELAWNEEFFQFIFAELNVPEAEDTSEGAPNRWLMYGEEAVADGKPSFTIKHSFFVAAGRNIVVKAWAFFDGQLFADSIGEPLPEKFRKEIEALLPELIYKEGGGGGEPITVPPASVVPGGAAGASHPHHRPVVGNVA